MSRLELYLRTQAELIAELERSLNDSNHELGTPAQLLDSLNDGLRNWAKRVVTPQIYPLDFASGIFEYALPSYLRAPFVVQIKSTVFGVFGEQSDADTNTYTWGTVAGYDIEPDGLGGNVLRLQAYPYAQAGRILWYADNGPVPTSAVTLSSDITAADTSIALTVAGAPDINQSGYFKFESEWASYSSLTRTSDSAYTATGCVRGLYGTLPAAHVATTVVQWGVAADDMRLWTQLLDHARAYVHSINLHKSTSEDGSRHEKLMSYYQTKADNFWRMQGYISQRKGSLLLKSAALGPYLS